MAKWAVGRCGGGGGGRLYDAVVVAGRSIPALIRDDLATLPPAHYASLRLLLGLLAAVAARSPTNKVQPRAVIKPRAVQIPDGNVSNCADSCCALIGSSDDGAQLGTGAGARPPVAPHPPLLRAPAPPCGPSALTSSKYALLSLLSAAIPPPTCDAPPFFQG